ncbi:MAG: RluA family pseudouridine synthase [Minisyncoccia bacterium]
MVDHLDVVYETDDFVIVNKPAGLLTHKTKLDSNELSLADILLQHYPFLKNVGENILRPGIVHRLDKNTSGLIIIAKNNIYFKYFKKLFQEHLIEKHYLALVDGLLKNNNGIIEKPISLKSGSIKRTVYKGVMTKTAVTIYIVLKRYKNFTLLDLQPQTGRTHQLRVHLASIGHPIVGDNIYSKKNWGLNRLFLHAYSLAFRLLNNEYIKIESELPNELQIFLNHLTLLNI